MKIFSPSTLVHSRINEFNPAPFTPPPPPPPHTKKKNKKKKNNSKKK